MSHAEPSITIEVADFFNFKLCSSRGVKHSISIIHSWKRGIFKVIMGIRIRYTEDIANSILFPVMKNIFYAGTHSNYIIGMCSG
jgi:hypothetical protein